MTVRKFFLLFALLTLSGCANVLNAVTSRGGTTIQNDLRYAEGPRGLYDLYVPDNAGPTTPVVVFFYGGSWDSGSKSKYLFVGQSLASAGIIVAIPDYRVYPDVIFPGFVEDGARAVAAIGRSARRGAAGLPAGNHPLFLMGHSAGAHIAALLNYDERYLERAGAGAVSGFVGLSGPYDFLPLRDERYKRIFPELRRAASQPVNFVDGSEPPALLLTGDADETVEPRNTFSLAERIRRAGGAARVKTFAGVGHIGAVAALATAISGDSAIRQEVVSFILTGR